MSILWDVAKHVAKKAEPHVLKTWDSWATWWFTTPAERAVIRADQREKAIAQQRTTRAKQRWARLDFAERLHWASGRARARFEWEDLEPHEKTVLLELERG